MTSKAEQTGAFFRGWGNIGVAGVALVVTSYIRPESSYWRGVLDRSTTRARGHFDKLPTRFPGIPHRRGRS